MERVEKRLEIAPEGEKGSDENVNVLDENHLLLLTEHLSQPELDFEKRMSLVRELQQVLGILTDCLEFEIS